MKSPDEVSLTFEEVSSGVFYEEDRLSETSSSIIGASLFSSSLLLSC